MKCLIMVKATKDSEAGTMPSEEMFREMGKFNEELVNAGIMLSGDGLQPSSKGVRVRFSGNERSVIEGPFPATSELVAGFWIWQVKSLDEAIAWVKRCPNPMLCESDIEIRQILEADDLGETYTPELRQQDERLRKQIEEKR
ncbi:YciI family protein [Undibacterium sp. TC9W]|uniref:YciI family protein n=1 Tax=Undibacterium sp. TC9W TaxID=3413053 RepID=UPI003BF1857A